MDARLRESRLTIKFEAPAGESKDGNEAVILSPVSREEAMVEDGRVKVLARGAGGSRCDLYCRDLQPGHDLAVGLVVALGTMHSPATLPADDPGVSTRHWVSFLLIASRNPLQHLSLIWFTVWSSVVHARNHGGTSSWQTRSTVGHLWGDVPALLVVAAVLALLTPRAAAAGTAVRSLGRTAAVTWFDETRQLDGPRGPAFITRSRKG